MTRTVCIDFDGVIHPNPGGYHFIDTIPTVGAKEALADLATKYRIVVCSARAADPDGHAQIEKYLNEHGLSDSISAIQAIKPEAIAYVDDRAIPFKGSWSDIKARIALMERETFLKNLTKLPR